MGRKPAQISRWLSARKQRFNLVDFHKPVTNALRWPLPRLVSPSLLANDSAALST